MTFNERDLIWMTDTLWPMFNSYGHDLQWKGLSVNDSHYIVCAMKSHDQ